MSPASLIVIGGRRSSTLTPVQKAKQSGSLTHCLFAQRVGDSILTP